MLIWDDENLVNNRADIRYPAQTHYNGGV